MRLFPHHAFQKEEKHANEQTAARPSVRILQNRKKQDVA